ncbi:hypothetical protein GGR57DRAFT_521110 [Xylariaceae sp. FL1272]|nr:hypothetical protein GGR57DRAFT_521110 [Xylariaceae sp. FL1272]
MEHATSPEQLHAFLWEALKVQLQPDNPFIRITDTLFVHLSDKGRQFLGEQLSSVLGGKDIEFIIDGYSNGQMFLANRQDLVHHSHRQILDGPDLLPVLLMVPDVEHRNPLPNASLSQDSGASSMPPETANSIAAPSASAVSAPTRGPTAHHSASHSATPSNYGVAAPSQPGVSTSAVMTPDIVTASRSIAQPPMIRTSGVTADPQARRQRSPPAATQNQIPAGADSSPKSDGKSAKGGAELELSNSDPVTRKRIEKPPNSWSSFLRDMSPGILKAHPGWNAIKINTHLGPVWRSMTDEQQKPWVDKADELQRQHKLEYPSLTRRNDKKRSYDGAMANVRVKQRKVFPVADLDEDGAVTLKTAIDMSAKLSAMATDHDADEYMRSDSPDDTPMLSRALNNGNTQSNAIRGADGQLSLLSMPDASAYQHYWSMTENHTENAVAESRSSHASPTSLNPPNMVQQTTTQVQTTSVDANRDSNSGNKGPH